MADDHHFRVNKVNAKIHHRNTIYNQSYSEYKHTPCHFALGVYVAVATKPVH